MVETPEPFNRGIHTDLLLTSRTGDLLISAGMIHYSLHFLTCSSSTYEWTDTMPLIAWAIQHPAIYGSICHEKPWPTIIRSNILSSDQIIRVKIGDSACWKISRWKSLYTRCFALCVLLSSPLSGGLMTDELTVVQPWTPTPSLSWNTGKCHVADQLSQVWWWHVVLWEAEVGRIESPRHRGRGSEPLSGHLLYQPHRK